jgi:hypothetical protein
MSACISGFARAREIGRQIITGGAILTRMIEAEIVDIAGTTYPFFCTQTLV